MRGPTINNQRSFINKSVLYSTKATAKLNAMAIVGFIHPPE